MKIYYHFTLLLILCISFSCQSDDDTMPVCDIPPTTLCEAPINFIPFIDTCFILPPEPSGGWFFKVDSFFFILPYFNLENKEEFLYNEHTSIVNKTFLININICSGEKKILLEDPIYGLVKPTWIHNNWIVFTDNMENLWKVKSNGDSLAQMTFEHQFRYPTPFPNNKLLVLKRDYPEMPNVYHSVVMNMDGEILDTLEQTVGISDYHNGKLAAVLSYEFFFRDLSTQEVTSIINLENTDHIFIYDIYWLDETHLIWYDNIGMHKVHVETGELTTLISNCDNRSIFSISVSPELDGSVIFMERHYTLVSSTTLQPRRRIFKLDTNTGEQYEIDLSP